jgi:hypothetical protein
MAAFSLGKSTWYILEKWVGPREILYAVERRKICALAGR